MIIVGTGGHASDLLSDGFVLKQYSPIYFYDSVNTYESSVVFGGYKVFSSLDELKGLTEEEIKFILAVGNPQIRRRLCGMMESAGFRPVTFISPFAMVAPTSAVGLGANIMPFAAIFGCSILGKGTLINSYASIHHDAVIGDFCEISPGARVLGRVRIGNGVQLGTNAIVLPGVTIGHFSIVGAGAVVTGDLPDHCTAVGVPAKIIKIENN